MEKRVKLLNLYVSRLEPAKTLELSEWFPHYRKISEALNLDYEEDQKATNLLSQILKDDVLPFDELKKNVENRVVIVFGAGPSLVNDLIRLQGTSILDSSCLITADGATTALQKIVKIRPNIIVTDLDGYVEDQINASREGSKVVVHAHGDNVQVIKTYVPRFSNKLGSTQVESKPNVYNFGGFTDGDRAAFLAVELGANALVLAGMDFGNQVGYYSKPNPYRYAFKIAKLKIGVELLEWLSNRTRIPLYNITARGISIQGFKKIEIDELLHLF